jgi:hypothetical protein
MPNALSGFVRTVPQVYYVGNWRCDMGPRKETTIERIFREVIGHKMPPSVRRILLRKPTAKRKAH